MVYRKVRGQRRKAAGLSGRMLSAVFICLIGLNEELLAKAHGKVLATFVSVESLASEKQTLTRQRKHLIDSDVSSAEGLLTVNSCFFWSVDHWLIRTHFNIVREQSGLVEKVCTAGRVTHVWDLLGANHLNFHEAFKAWTDKNKYHGDKKLFYQFDHSEFSCMIVSFYRCFCDPGVNVCNISHSQKNCVWQ